MLRNIQNAYLAATGKARKLTIETVSNKATKKGKSAAQTPEERQVFRTQKDIKGLENAIGLADSQTYDREDLHSIYRQHVFEDLHVSSQWQNRKFKTIGKSFAIYKIGEAEPDEEKTALFKKAWFYDLIDKMLESRAWGFQCVELFNWDKEKQSFEPYRSNEGLMMDAVQIINHDFVKPETGYIVPNSSEISSNVDILKYRDQLIYAGNKDHGFYYKLAKLVLFKNNGLANWSEWIEVFGLETVLVKSDAEGTERNQLLTALQQLGTSRTAVLDPDDDIVTAGSSKQDAYKVFEQLARYVDESISKAIHGQDVVSNNTGQVVGNVGENVANDYMISDAKFISNITNEQVFNLMTSNNYVDLNGYEFRYIESKSTRELNERANLDLKISQMGFSHDTEQINERYGTNVESIGSNVEQVKNRLKSLYPTYGKD